MKVLKRSFFLLSFTAGIKRLVVFKPEYVKQVLVSNFKYYRPDVIKEAVPSIGNGLFSSNGKEHAWQRKTITPTFGCSSIKIFVGIFDKCANNLPEVSSLYHLMLNGELKVVSQFIDNFQGLIC